MEYDWGMKIKQYLGLFLVSGLVLAGCGTKTETTKLETKPTETVGGKIMTSLSDLVKKGNNQICTYAMADGKAVSSVMVSGNKFYQETVMKDKEVENIIYSLSDGEWIYTWNSMQKNSGIKMNIKQLEEDAKKVAPTGTTQTENKVDLNEQQEVDCQKWNVDESKFVIPKEVVFEDFSKTMTDFQKQVQNPDNKAELCKLCDLSPDEKSKTECRTGLACQ